MTNATKSAKNKSAVLVVDDEQMLGRVIERFLRSDYEVIAVTSAQLGLEQLSEREDIGCILCDLMMPEMTGMEFYEELRERFPEYVSRVAFLSGGAFTPEAKQFISAGEHSVIEKPFRPEQLRSAVVELTG